MPRSHRIEELLSLLEERKVLRLWEARDLLGVSVATLRRDFRLMEEQGHATRTRGGLALHPDSLSRRGMLPLSFRQGLRSAEKRLIAARAAQLLADGDAVFLDGGTTTFHLAAHLADRPLHVITNSIVVGYQIGLQRRARVGAKVTIIGGVLDAESGLVVGPSAHQQLAGYRARWLFLSAGGLSADGISNADERVVEGERTMLEHCEKVAVLADHGKFNHRELLVICQWAEVDCLVTDRRPPAPLARSLASAGVEVLIAGAKELTSVREAAAQADINGLRDVTSQASPQRRVRRG